MAVQSGAPDILDTLQKRAAERYSKEHPTHALSPSDIMAWVQVAQAVIELIQQCRKKQTAEQIKHTIQHPGMLVRANLRRQLQLRLGSQLFKRHGDHLNQILCQIGQDAAPAEIEQLCSQVTGS